MKFRQLSFHNSHILKLIIIIASKITVSNRSVCVMCKVHGAYMRSEKQREKWDPSVCPCRSIITNIIIIIMSIIHITYTAPKQSHIPTQFSLCACSMCEPHPKCVWDRFSCPHYEVCVCVPNPKCMPLWKEHTYAHSTRCMCVCVWVYTCLSQNKKKSSTFVLTYESVSLPSSSIIHVLSLLLLQEHIGQNSAVGGLLHVRVVLVGWC